MTHTLNRIKSFSLFWSALFLISCSSGNDSDFCSHSSAPRVWTLMVYFDGDDPDLEDNALVDFNELEKGLYDLVANGTGQIADSINIIVMIDRYLGGDATATEPNGINWRDTRLYRVCPDDNMIYFNSERLDDGADCRYHIEPLNEKNLGDPNTLSDFIAYSKTWFPADNYGLILWNHGGGAQKKGASVITDETTDNQTKAICWDSDNDDDPLYIDELQQAISRHFNREEKLRLLGFDACLMGTFEVAYEFRDTVEYMVGSMSYIQDGGWDYDSILTDITTETITPDAFAELLVRNYRNSIDSNPALRNYGETISAINLQEIGSLADAVNSLGVSIYNENRKADIEAIKNETLYFYGSSLYAASYPYLDLSDFSRRLQNDGGFSASLTDAAQAVIDALSVSILISYGDTGINQSPYYGSGTETRRGLSLFFPVLSHHYPHQGWYTSESTSEYYSNLLYGNIDFCTSNADGMVDGWRELMEAWYDPDNDHTPSTF